MVFVITGQQFLGLACADSLLLSVVRQLFDFPLAGTNKTFTKSKTLYTLHQSSQLLDIQLNTRVKSGCRVVKRLYTLHYPNNQRITAKGVECRVKSISFATFQKTLRTLRTLKTLKTLRSSANLTCCVADRNVLRCQS